MAESPELHRRSRGFLRVCSRFARPSCGLALLGAASCKTEEAAPAWLNSAALPPKPLSEEQTRPFRGCETQADCEITLNGCCDCANGGEDIAVNKQQVAAFRRRFDCSQTHCNNEGAMAPCRSGEVSCVDGLCRYARPAARR